MRPTGSRGDNDPRTGSSTARAALNHDRAPLAPIVVSCEHRLANDKLDLRTPHTSHCQQPSLGGHHLLGHLGLLALGQRVKEAVKGHRDQLLGCDLELLTHEPIVRSVKCNGHVPDGKSKGEDEDEGKDEADGGIKVVGEGADGGDSRFPLVDHLFFWWAKMIKEVQTMVRVETSGPG